MSLFFAKANLYTCTLKWIFFHYNVSGDNRSDLCTLMHFYTIEILITGNSFSAFCRGENQQANLIVPVIFCFTLVLIYIQRVGNLTVVLLNRLVLFFFIFSWNCSHNFQLKMKKNSSIYEK